jgi:AcrR family transcriptional regulator
MRVTKEQKEQTRQKIIEAAGKGFRAHGYGGLGVDGLAKGADVTSGAFYGHFSSKDEAFKAAIEKGMKDYADTVNALQNQHGSHWIQELLDYYLGEDHRNDLSGSCAVPGLSAEVMRADQGTKAIYEEGLIKVAEAVADNNNAKTEDALALMALLAGSVLLSRSVSSKETAERISKATRKFIEKTSN